MAIAEPASLARYCAPPTSARASSFSNQLLSVTGGRDLPALDQLPAGLVDAPVNGLEEMPRLQKSEHAVGRFVVDEDGAEQRLFGLDVVGRLPVGDALLASGLDDGGAGAEDGLINHGTAVLVPQPPGWHHAGVVV